MTAQNQSRGTTPSTFVRDGSTSDRAILPGDSRPGWDEASPGNTVVYSEPDNATAAEVTALGYTNILR